MPPTPSALSPVPGLGLADDELALGEIVGIFGVRGEVRLHLHNRDSSLLHGAAVEVVLIDPAGARYAARCKARPGSGKRILGALGLRDRDEARDLMGWQIAVPTGDLPKLEPYAFYVWQVEGLPVWVDGERYGEVVTVHATAGGDVLELALNPQETLFVPMLREWVEVDLVEGCVRVDPEALV